MAWKLKRKKTRDNEERIKSLEDRLDGAIGRLDAAMAESKRLSRQMDELQRHDHMRDLRKTLNKRFGRPPTSGMDTYDADDTVN